MGRRLDPDRPLTPRQERFVQAYIVKPDAAAAAREAGYSERTAKQQGYDLLRDERIAARIRADRADRARRARRSGDEVIQRLEAIAFGDPRQVAKWGKASLELVPSDDLDDDAAATISEIKVRPGEFGPSVSFKRVDPVKALQLLAEHHGLLERPDRDGGVDDALDAALDEAEARREALADDAGADPDDGPDQPEGPPGD